MEQMFEKGYRIEAKDPLQGTKNEPVWALAQRDIALAMKLAEDPKSKTIAINFMGKSTPQKKDEAWEVVGGVMHFHDPGRSLAQQLKEAEELAKGEEEKRKNAKDAWKMKLMKMKK